MTEKKIKHPAFAIWNQLKKNKIAVIGLIIVSLYVFCAIFAPYISPYDSTKQNLAESFQSPNVRHLLGCDDFGRDILSRIIWGARISLLIQLSSVVLTLIIGILLGALGGYYRGKIDEVIMGFMDILLAFPGMLLALAMVAMLVPSLRNLIIAIGVYSVPQFAHITRGAVLAVRANEYIIGAKAIGESDAAIIIRYVLPNTLSPIIVQTTLRMATVLPTASGLGVQPPNPEWGTMLSSARMYLRAVPHVAIFLGLAIMITVLGFNFLGDGLQDALNPRLKE